MKLDKLRGYGPWFAFATPAFFLLSFATFVVVTASIRFTADNIPIIPDWFTFGVGTLLILLALTILSSLVVAIDLEWIEHPRTHTGLTYVGLGGMVVSTLAFLALLLDAAFVRSAAGNVEAFVFFGGLGIYLVVMNWVGMRAQLLGRIFPWVGIVSGALWLLVALSVVGVYFLGLALLPAIPLFLGWSIGLGFKLRGSVPASAPTAG